MAKESNISLIVRNAGLDAVGTGINFVIMFATSVLITRTIGADLFGKYSLSNSIFLVIKVFAVFGLNTGVVRLTSKYTARRDRSRVKGTLLSGVALAATFSLVLLGLVAILSPTLAAKVFTEVEGISWVLRVHFIALPFFALMAIMNAYTQGFKTLKYSVIVEFLTRPSVRLAAVALLFLAGLRLDGVLYGTVLSFVVAACLGFYFALKVPPFHFRGTKTQLVTHELFIYSLPLVFARLANEVIGRSNMILVGYFKDSTSTGLFGAAVMLAPFISLSLHSFSKILAPMISEFWETGEMAELESTFKTVTKWIFSLGFPVFLLLMLLPRSLLLIFGADFGEAATTLSLLAVGHMVNASVGPIGYVLSMTGRQKLNLVNSVVLAVLNVGLGMVLIPRYGIVGAALGTTISLAAVNGVRVVQVKILYGFTPFRWDFAKPVLAGIISFGTFYFLIRYLGWEGVARTLVLCMAFAATYFGILYAFGLKEEKEVLVQILRRRRARGNLDNTD